jgi:hypothetical protein
LWGPGDKQVANLHPITCANADASDSTGLLRTQLVLHLHGLDNQQHLTGAHLLPARQRQRARRSLRAGIAAHAASSARGGSDRQIHEVKADRFVGRLAIKNHRMLTGRALSVAVTERLRRE